MTKKDLILKDMYISIFVCYRGDYIVHGLLFLRSHHLYFCKSTRWTVNILREIF